MNEKEKRFIVATELRLQRNADTKTATLRGYAAVFDKRSEDLGGFFEQIEKGAFARALKEGQDVRALFNHDGNFVLGRSTAGTLRMSEDKKGLAVEIDLPDTQAGRDVGVMVERGDVSQMSFAFRTVKDSWEHRDNEPSLRTLLDVDLYDVSAVTYPAYPDTSLALRSLEEARKQIADPAIEIETEHRRLDLIINS